MFYIFHGDEEFLRSEAVASLRNRMAEEELGELNISELDGRDLPLEELINACNTLPFFTQRRMIIVSDMLQRFQRAGGAEDAARLAAYLPHMPETTRLVFVESAPLRRDNPLLARVQGLAGGHIREYAKLDPRSQELRRWIAQRARLHGVAIEPPSVELLIELVGNDLRALDRELAKLAGGVNYARPIAPEDVRALASPWPQRDIFGLVDALGNKDRRMALRLFHALLEDQAEPLYLLSMIARQLRLILATKDLKENQSLGPAAIAKELRLSRFVVDKLERQTPHFAFQELHGLMERLLEVDQGIKTGSLDAVLALELLIVDICRRTEAAAREPQRARNRSRTR